VLDPQIQAAVIGAAATAIAATVGFGGLILQLRSQGRQSREAIAENERRKLKAEMYQKAVAETRQLADAAITLDVMLRRLQIELTVAAHANLANLGYPLPSVRYSDVLEKSGEFMDAALQFIFTVENWRFLDPRIIVFRSAMNVVLHDLRELLHREFSLHVMPTLPVQAPDGTIFQYTPPSPAGAEKVKDLCDKACACLIDVTSYTEDYTVELQNVLLGDLFDTQVPHRIPLDPRSKVITLDRAEELERFFETSTAWGTNLGEVNAKTKASLADHSGDGAADKP
jgi:hypothetical protein